MKKAAVLAVLVSFCLLFAGCGEPGEAAPSPSPSPSAEPTPPAAEEAPFALAYDPQGTWNPYEGSGNANMSLCGLVYEGLFQLDNTFTPSPVLAEWAEPSEDGSVWTIKLRDGVTFSDGTPLTAQAAGQALNRAKDKKSAYAPRLSGISRVTWDRELTLTLTLRSPNVDLPALLDLPIALVAEDGCFGTGPYRLEGDKLAVRMDWWQKRNVPERALALTPVGGADDLIAAFDGGRVSVAATDMTGPNALGYAGVCQTWEYPTSTMLFVGYRASGGPCAARDFRRAITMGYDRSKLAVEVLAGHAAVAAFPAPPTSARYDREGAAQLSYAPEKAAEALAAMGYKMKADGLLYQGRSPVTLTLLVNSDNSYKVRAAYSLADDLKALGITVTVKALGWESYLKALGENGFDLYLGEVRLTGDLDLTPFFTGESGLSYGGFWSEDLNRALASGRATGDWTEFDRLWLEEAPFGVLCFKAGTVLTGWGRCEGLSPTQGNLYYGIENWKIK